VTRTARQQKSTGVRIGGLHVALLRGYFRTLAHVAPRTAERHAAALFCFPRRLSHHDVPEVPAHAHVQYVAVGEKRITVWTWGDGPRVVLAHGWEGTARDVVPIALALAERGRSVAVFDMPAHGASTGRTTTLPEMADAVGAVAHATGTPAAVVGHSLGAAAAVLALRDGLGASTAALIAPAAEPRLFVRRLADVLGFSDAQHDGLVKQIEHRAGIGIDEIDSARVARALTARALILHDPADRQVPFSHGEALAHAWRGATLQAVHGLGHRRVLYDRAAIERVVAHIIG
jgi:pimeloyl-ACP methyl ester carboxylesterase